jgi:outer membrane protein TolC
VTAERGRLFEQVAEEYDRARLGYAAEIVDAACTIAGVGPGSPVLEIGCGTGKLTEMLVGRSLRVVAVDRAAAAAPLPGVEALVERAESARGELLALRKEADAAGFSRRAADRRNLPEPEIVAGSKSSNAFGGDVGSVITIHATIPLFDRSAPERALAAARAKQADALAAAFRLTLRSEIAALRSGVVERRQSADRYRAAALESAGQMERIAQVSYDAGERGILELLDAFRIGASARVRQATLDLAVRESEIELEFVSGWEIP